MDPGLDWDVFRAALFAILDGQNPYLIGSGHIRFFNPPWMLLILFPLLILPRSIGIIANMVISFLALIPVTRKLGFNAWHYLFIATSWIHLVGIGKTNIEWLPWIGILLPAPVAVLFLAIKPQSTLGFILYIIWKEWHQKGWRGVGFALAPTLVLSALTVIIWGVPDLPGGDNPANLTAFPFSLLAAIPLLYYSLRNDSPNLAAAASPFFSPYNTLHGYLPVLFGSRRWIILLIIWLLSMVPLVLIILGIPSPF